MNENKYYVYYDKKTGRILSVSNEQSTTYEYGIETEFEDVENFLNGTWHFKDYIVDYVKTSTGETILKVMSTEDQGYTFKNNLFEWITESKENSDCTVEWDGPNQCWNFILDAKTKKVFREDLLTPRLLFFVMLDADFDFLIRTIFIDFDELMLNDKISVPFNTKFEKDCDKVSMASRLVFKKYKLRIINE